MSCPWARFRSARSKPISQEPKERELAAATAPQQPKAELPGDGPPGKAVHGGSITSRAGNAPPLETSTGPGVALTLLITFFSLKNPCSRRTGRSEVQLTALKTSQNRSLEKVTACGYSGKQKDLFWEGNRAQGASPPWKS